ncbi:MAG: molybdenum cofactor guanylyltransferase, partial [Armatimonadota bacterium]
LVKASWIGHLLAHRRENALAVAFHHETWEPLCALYSRDTRTYAEKVLAAGRQSLKELLMAVAAIPVALPSDWPPIVQINTPDDLQRAEEWLKSMTHPEA